MMREPVWRSMSQPVDKLEMPTPINGEISFYFDAERLQHPIY